MAQELSSLVFYVTISNEDGQKYFSASARTKGSTGELYGLNCEARTIRKLKKDIYENIEILSDDGTFVDPRNVRLQFSDGRSVSLK